MYNVYMIHTTVQLFLLHAGANAIHIFICITIGYYDLKCDWPIFLFYFFYTKHLLQQDMYNIPRSILSNIYSIKYQRPYIRHLQEQVQNCGFMT